MLEKTVIKSNDTKKHSSKTWKEYFLEFLMLFLAVSLGFMADNIRENISENKKEKEYIQSMIADAETDIFNIKKALESNNLRIKHLDSLSYLCINYDQGLNTDSKLYKHYLYGLMHPDFITPTTRTMQQLKNAGGMRLIRNKLAADLIILYDGNTDKLANQQMFYERYQNKSIDFAVKLFNFQNFGISVIANNSVKINNKGSYKIFLNDKSELFEFGNIILTYQGVATYYDRLLKNMIEQADYLIKTLKKEYDLD